MNLPQLVRRMLWLAGATALLALAGCGGGGSSDAGASAPGSPAPGTLSVEQRSLATGRLAERFEQITGGADTATAEMWEQLRAWAVQQPEFSDAGVGDQLLWARFRDGRYFLFTDNWRPLPQQPLAALITELAPAALLKNASTTTDALMLSDSDEAFNAVAPVMDRMAAALHRSGWAPTARRELRIDTLKRQGELGFLFLTAHSGIFGPTGGKQFAMVTDDLVTEEGDVSYASELEDGSLIYHRDRRFLEWLGITNNMRYAITARFVDRYLRFSPDALVILASCHSGSAEAAGFRSALHMRGAGTIVGWEGNTNPQAYEMVDLMVDRLSGMNAVRKVTPPNRPFNFDDVWNYLEQKGLLLTPGPEVGDSSTPVRRFGTGFQILQPVLAALELTGIDKLRLHGDFGEAPATVTVGGTQVAATVVQPGKVLQVHLGPQAHGDVVVTARDRRSNRRVLGSWRGSVRYRQTFDDACAQEVFSNTVEYHLHLRADMHEIRHAIDAPPVSNMRMLMPASDTAGSWSARGRCSRAADDYRTWSGSGPLQLFFPGESAPTQYANVLNARLELPQPRTWFQLNPQFTSERLIQQTTESGSSQLRMVFDVDLFEFVNDGSSAELLPYGNFLRLDNARNIVAGQFEKAQPHRPGRSLSAEWGAMTVAPAYDASVPR